MARDQRAPLQNIAPMLHIGRKYTMYDLSKLPASTRDQITNSPRWSEFFSRKPDQMLRVGGDAKTSKGEKLNVRTAVLYLIPADGSGVNVCPLAALAMCSEPCLNTAGRGAFDTTQMARLRKTLFLQQYRQEALHMIHKEIVRLSIGAERDGQQLAIRLNGTSDLRWENYSFGPYANLMAANPNVQFYDYTKLVNRKNVPANYDLTFSYSGVAAYQPFVNQAVNAGMRIAVVYRSRKLVESMLAEQVATWRNLGIYGMRLVDGDDTDVRHRDPKGVVVALYAKGKAKKDTSGFVVD